MTKLSKLALFVCCSLASQLATSAVISHMCHIKETRMLDMGTSTARTHVLCVNPVQDGATSVHYFALPQDSSGAADGLLTLGSMAMSSGRKIEFLFNSGDTSGASYGCLATDCRKPFQVNVPNE